MLGRKRKVPTEEDMKEIEILIEKEKQKLIQKEKEIKEQKELERLNIETQKKAEEEKEKYITEFDKTMIYELGMPYEIWSKTGALYFDTDRTCQLVDVKINKDASFQIGDKIFDMAKGKPYILKIDKKTARPIYILRHNNIVPIDISDLEGSTPSPEEASRLTNLKTLETLSTIAGAKLRKSVLVILVAASMMAGIVIKWMLGIFGIW